MSRVILSVLGAAVLWLGAAQAQAATYTVCLRIPVTIDDEAGGPTEVGSDGNWIARGIQVDYVRAPNGVLVGGFPRNAGQSNGCFTFTSRQSGSFEIGIQPRGVLADNNTLRIRNSSGNSFIYVASFNLSSGTHAYVWPYERVMPRMYAIYAYAIQSGFRGNYDDEQLIVQVDRTNPCSSSGCNNTCGQNGDLSYICISGGSTGRKYLMVHEYGHVNIRHTTSFSNTNNCGYSAPGASSSSHEMRGLEFDSCAAMEGWANFVAAEVWNPPHSWAGDDPPATLRYWGDGNAVVPVEGETGGCWSSINDNDGDYRRAFADNCNGTNAGGTWDSDPNCSGGNCIGYGTELDWMRMWWDFYTDKDMAGSPQSPTELQALIQSTGGWGSTNAWTTFDAAAVGTLGTRFDTAGNWNGTSE